MGGSQLNAIEIAAATRDLGHDVVIYGQPGVLNGHIEHLGLEFVASPPIGQRPSPAVVRHLRRLIRVRDIDILHGYEWPPTLEARLAVAGTSCSCVSTVMSMAVAPFIPHNVDLIVGTRQIEAVERERGRGRVSVIEPPVDTDANAPGLGLDVSSFREQFGIPATGIHLVCVTRLAYELKLEGLLTAIEVVPTLDETVTFTIVGDGPARDHVVEAVERTNARAGRRAVVLTGLLEDPRPAYESADIMLGMGGSAIRSMAFGKPLIVQGEQGFWLTLSADTQRQFEWTGWYGVGAGRDSGADALRAELAPLLADAALRSSLGDFGRRLAVDRFSLQATATRQADLYAATRANRGKGRRDLRSDPQALARFAAYKGERLLAKFRGNSTLDDFNSNPAVAPKTRHDN